MATLLTGTAMLVGMAGPGEARLTRLIIEQQTEAPPATPGAPAYRLLTGWYQGELDPVAAANRIITDITKAERAPNGKVVYKASFAIAVPANPARASGFLFYDVPNRGRGGAAGGADGHIRVTSGWQGDIVAAPGVQWLEAPVARGTQGRPVTGLILQRLINMPAGAASVPIVGGIDRPTPRPVPVTLDTRRARLFRQASDGAAQVDIPARDWAFADCRRVAFPGKPDPTQICVRGRFDNQKAYTVVYRSQSPKVLGVGFAAVRDFNDFLRHGQVDDAGTPNPVAGMVKWTIATGISQSGNFVRSFIALGFNAAEDGRRVFDGANPDIAARQLPLNIRFGVPGGAAAPFEPGSEGPLWWTRYDDRMRGRGISSLLDRCDATNTCPKIAETFGSAEFWGLRMSADLVGTDARSDLPLPPNVRRYYSPGVTHGGSRTGGFPLAGDPPYPGAPRCTLANNPNPSSDMRRAILKALERWVAGGREPPASRYPTISAGDLVAPTAEAMGWPSIPHVPRPDGLLNAFLDQDLGKRFNYRDFSGLIDPQPPRVRRVIRSLVPRVDADGNETAGIRSVQLQVPIGTYTGWNQLAEGFGTGGGCGFSGGFIPFAKTEAERRAAGDPRPSLEARYQTHEGFVARVREATARQVAAGWLLPDDAARDIDQAEVSAVLR